MVFLIASSAFENLPFCAILNKLQYFINQTAAGNMNPFFKFFHYLFCDRGIALAATWSFNQLAYAIIYPFIPIYMCEERGLPYGLVSMIFPLLGVATILAPVPCGWLTDRSDIQ